MMMSRASPNFTESQRWRFGGFEEQVEDFTDEETKAAERLSDFPTIDPDTRPRAPYSPGPDLVPLQSCLQHEVARVLSVETEKLARKAL